MPQSRTAGTAQSAFVARHVSVLRATAACFSLRGCELVTPIDLALERGEQVEVVQPESRSASLAARICAGVVKPTAGSVCIEDYDTRLQPAQAKRSVSFVPAQAEAFVDDFLRSLLLYAALFEVERRDAARRVVEVEALLGRGPYAHAVALALSHDAPLIVLDQPPPAVRDAIALLRPQAAIVCARAGPPQATPADGAAALRAMA